MRLMEQAFDNKRIIIRAVLSVMVIVIIAGVIYFLLTHTLDKSTETTLNVVVGALLSSLIKVIDFWFKKDTDDSEHVAALKSAASRTESTTTNA